MADMMGDVEALVKIRKADNDDEARAIEEELLIETQFPPEAAEDEVPDGDS